MLDVAAVMCMSLTMYHEARGEPVPGQVAVGYVLYRRADFNQKKICSETFKADQFEWTQKTKYIPPYSQLKPFVLLSEKIIKQEIKDSSKGASYFHNVSMPNQWGMKPRAVINNHVFYQEAMMDNEFDLEAKKIKKPVKVLQKLYDDPTEDNDDINDFKYDHGIKDHYDE